MLESLGIDDVYALEVFDIRVSQIRLYTRYFMIRNLTKDVPFRRIEDGC